MSAQLEAEKRLTGNASASTLWKELVTIPGNRKRAIISVLLMVCQQMTGLSLLLSRTSDSNNDLLSSERSGVDRPGLAGILCS